MTPFHPSTTKLAGRAFVGSVAALLAVLAPSPSAGAQCQYSVTVWSAAPCTSHPPNSYTGTGLNDLGAWCGYRFMCWEEGDGWLPVYCPPGGMPQVLPIPEGASEDGARANAVNDSGVVVGYMYTGSSSQYFVGVIWPPGGPGEVIEPLSGVGNSVATDINEAGVIVGYTNGHPYVLEDGLMTIIPDPGLGNGSARQIADSGHVTGVFGNLNQDARAFRWKAGRLVLLEPLEGFPVSNANGINSFGHVAGQSRTTGSPVTGKPTIWIDDLPIELPLPPGYTTGGATRINDAGVVVGSCSGPGLPATPVCWIDREPILLNSQLLPGSPSAGLIVAINEVGQMLSGGGPRLLTPIGWSPADLNGDCAVNGDDLGVLLSSWGVPDFDPRCDFNDDGTVDGDDLGTLLGEWSVRR